MINRDMQPFMLQAKENIEKPSGAIKNSWVDLGIIYVSVYEINDTLNTQSIRYNSSTHTGLTVNKEVKEGINRLIDNDIVYEVISANPKGRLNSLLLRVVDTNV